MTGWTSLARLVHPVIPPVHLIGENEDGKPVLVMQLVSGECWSDLLAKDGKELDLGSEAALMGHLDILIRIGEASPIRISMSRCPIKAASDPRSSSLPSLASRSLQHSPLTSCMTSTGLPSSFSPIR